MKPTVFPVATFTAALLAVFGASTVARSPQKVVISPKYEGTGPSSSGRVRVSTSQSRQTSEPCKAGQPCEDPAVRAGRIARQEAENLLREKICGFLAEYGTPDQELLEAQKKGAPTNDTYCEAGDAAKISVSANVTGAPKVDRAVRPKVVIAVLPDPVHTQLALRFDQSADELQSSMQDLGWTYDRAWLPWDNKDHEEAQNFDDRTKNRVAQEYYGTSPGVILFRGSSNGDPKQPLIVLVVGDTSTGGVDPAQFRNAIRIWQELTGWNNYFHGKKLRLGTPQVADASTLMILGPTYSGSAPSLKSLLRELTQQAGTPADLGDYACPAKDLHIFIASGTISGRGEISSLESSRACEHLQVVPSSFAVDIDYANSRLLRFLADHLRQTDERECRFAVLSEGESTFGQSDVSRTSTLPPIIAKIKQAISHADPTEKGRLELLEDQFDRDLRNSKFLDNTTRCHYYFPREISQLRAAYEQNNIFGFSSESTSLRTQLHLSLSRRSAEDDTIHTFSGQQDAAAIETAMAEIATDLEQRRTSIILLSATDVLDEIFVTRYLAQHAPNATVIVSDTDLLFLRDGDLSMRNAYVIGPWPLIPGNQTWSIPAQLKPDAANSLLQIRNHSSAGGEGLHAAARFLICRLGQMPLQSCSPDPRFKHSVSIPEYQLPIATWAATTNDLKAEPPLWLSAVGRGGFWPVSLVDVDQAGERLPESAADNLPRLMDVELDPKSGAEKPLPPVWSTGIKEPDPRGITMLTCVVALLLGIHGLASIRARLDRGFAWSYALSDPAQHRIRQFLQIAITLAAVPALVLLKTRIEAGVAIRSVEYTAFNWVLQIVALILTIWPLGLFVGIWPWRGVAHNREAVVAKFAAAILLEVAFVFVCNWWLWDLIAPPAATRPTERAFFFYRSGHLFSGSSPVMPVLLLGAALVLYLVSLFERFIFYKHRIPQLPAADPELHCPGPANVLRLDRLLSHTWDHWRLILLVVVALLLALCFLGLGDVSPRSLTGGRFDVVIDSLAGLVIFLLLYDLVSAVMAWFLLRSDCLLPLSRSPLRWGFTWIKGWSWKRLWAPGAISPNRAFDYLSRLSEANLRAVEDPAITDAFANMRQQFENQPRDIAWAGEVTARLGIVQKKLAASATNKLSKLKQLYAQDHGPITGSVPIERGLRDEIPLEKREASDPASEGWIKTMDRMASEEFVALLYLGYCRAVLLQIRSRVLTATGMYILLLWGLTSYPFLNHHYIVMGMAWLLFFMATAVIWVYSQMHRDDILSRTTETESGKLDGDFFVKMLSIVGIPLLTLIASQFPEIGGFLFSWFEPGLSSMH